MQVQVQIFVPQEGRNEGREGKREKLYIANVTGN
jgi:hypothetical protein